MDKTKKKMNLVQLTFIVAVNMMGAVSPAARANPSSEPVTNPPAHCGRMTDQMTSPDTTTKTTAAIHVNRL